MEHIDQKMKVCVIGGGFTGTLAALAIKRHLPHSYVTLIDPGNEMKMPGLGLSMPAHTVQSINRLLNYPVEHSATLLKKIICETNSTAKINVQWRNFRDRVDNGWYSGLPTLPSAEIVENFGLSTDYLRRNIKLPSADQYQLTDLWFELWLKNERNFESLNPEINSYYWYCESNKIPNFGLFENLLPTIHANSWDFGRWLKQSLGSEIDQTVHEDVGSVALRPDGSVDTITMASGLCVQADFYIDCTGFKRLLGRTVKAKYQQPPGHVFNNCSVVVGQGYTQNIDQEMHPYTIGYGMDYGWTFCIPMKHGKSFGYNFNTEFITAEQALTELEQLAPAKNRVYDPEILRWRPGYFPDSMAHNYAMVGISSGFTDPFEAHSVGLQLGQLHRIVQYLKELEGHNQFTPALDKDPVNYNDFTRNSFCSVVQRLDFHMCLAPRSTSEYWQRNHQLAQQHDMVNKIFEVINDPCHYEPARHNHTYKPYPGECYLTESFYFGVNLSRRCRESSPELLQLADKYFANFSDMNRLRANMTPTQRQWYSQYGIDLDSLITIK